MKPSIQKPFVYCVEMLRKVPTAGLLDISNANQNLKIHSNDNFDDVGFPRPQYGPHKFEKRTSTT